MSLLHPRGTGPRPAALPLLAALALPLLAAPPARAAASAVAEGAPAAPPSSAEIPPASGASPPAAPDDAATPEARRVEACKAHALERLKRASPSIEDIFIDMDGLTIAAADMRIGPTRITSVLMGEAYIQRDRKDNVHRFLCLTGDDDAVLLTFFTEQ